MQLLQGDCKDYALLKYAVLKTIGLQAAIVLGEFKSVMKHNPQHAWCATLLDGAWRRLDNMFDQIIRIEDDPNWIPQSALHDDSVVKFGPVFSIDGVLNAGKVAS